MQFEIPEYIGAIPCPHCGARDCAGVQEDLLGQEFWVCSQSGERLTYTQLRRSAERHGNPRRPQVTDPAVRDWGFVVSAPPSSRQEYPAWAITLQGETAGQSPLTLECRVAYKGNPRKHLRWVTGRRVKGDRVLTRLRSRFGEANVTFVGMSLGTHTDP